MKMADIPHIEVAEGLSPTSCNDLINSLKFRQKGKSWKLQMNAETIIRDVESGQIKDEDNAVSCKGQTNIVH